MITQIFTLARYVVLEAFRTHLFAVIATLLLISVGLSLFLGQITLIESQATQSSLVAAFLRLSTLYLMSLFVITSMVREFNERSIYLWLSFPMSRSVYLLGKLSGFALIAVVIALFSGIPLLKYAPYLQVGLWTLSLWCELLMICTISFLFVLTFHQTVQAFSAILAFYILARGINAIQLMTQSPVTHSSSSWVDSLINQLVAVLAMLLPNLERFTQSEWLVYATGSWNDVQVIGLQTMIYVTLLGAMSLFDFYRKNL
jgi:ABC-type transport system involved in multi-copper enzyme maturation permease subunit